MESIFENTTTLTRQNLTEMARATVPRWSLLVGIIPAVLAVAAAIWDLARRGISLWAGLLLLAAFGVLAAMHEKEFSRENWDQLRQILPDLLFLLGGILTLFGTKMYLDSAYHPTWGDRSDGRKLR